MSTDEILLWFRIVSVTRDTTDYMTSLEIAAELRRRFAVDIDTKELRQVMKNSPMIHYRDYGVAQPKDECRWHWEASSEGAKLWRAVKAIQAGMP